jgi:O-succinylbenzoate synthase
MVTSGGTWSLRQGWLLRLEAAEGGVGWGEAALPPVAIGTETTEARTKVQCAQASLPTEQSREAIERLLPGLPAPLACALGMALAELDGLGSADQGGWLTAPPSSLLLPAGEAAVTALEETLATGAGAPSTRAVDGGATERSTAATAAALQDSPHGADRGPASADATAATPLTVKWKVASGDDALERRVLERLLERLPPQGRLRLDANGGWDRATAWRWAERLAGDLRLDWLEQPLAPGDREGLEALARTLPVALDESLRLDPELTAGGWEGWQVRRPLAEADPRPLLAALRAGTPRLMLSTALETGIGRRFLHHLAGLQALGPTPTAPGLAPGWRPRGRLFSPEPEAAWEAAE